MISSYRDELMRNLKRLPSKILPDQPREGFVYPKSCYEEASLENLFCEKLIAHSGIVYRHNSAGDLGDRIERIFKDHGISRAIASCDMVLTETRVADLARQHGLDIRTQKDFLPRRLLTDALFEDAYAGLTGSNFGIAETGSLVLAFDQDHARLISLAPPVHIAVLPVDRILATFEEAVSKIYGIGKDPSQVVFITGPSSTGDIEMVFFRGMHGPKKLIVLLI
jgi:L-lactate dehydrogenase complex protein LldG